MHDAHSSSPRTPSNEMEALMHADFNEMPDDDRDDLQAEADWMAAQDAAHGPFEEMDAALFQMEAEDLEQAQTGDEEGAWDDYLSTRPGYHGHEG